MNNLGLFIFPSARISVIGPIRPMIISIVNIIFDPLDAIAVKPDDNPTVPNAEHISNNILFDSALFSIFEVIIKEKIITYIPTIAIVIHLFTWSSGISRPKIDVF